MTIYDDFPACHPQPEAEAGQVARRTSSSIKLGTGTSDGGVENPAGAAEAQQDRPEVVQRLTIDVKLRDTMLLKGEVDAVIGFDYTSIFNLMGNGVKIEDINLLYYTAYGFDFWGNSLIASREMIEKNPDLVKRVVARYRSGLDRRRQATRGSRSMQ